VILEAAETDKTFSALSLMGSCNLTIAMRGKWQASQVTELKCKGFEMHKTLHTMQAAGAA